jgi:tetratricopeptide (TPR) repeat protein
VPPSAVGYFTSDFLGQPTVVVHPAALRLDAEVIAHELAHHFAWYFFPRQPRWFGEGLAHFVQTVASETPGYENAVGVVPGLRAERLRSERQVEARDLLAWRGWSHDGARLQLWSWVLYHWLWNERPRQLAELQARLARAEDPAAAWLAAFPDLDPADAKAMKKLDAALDEHRRSAELVYYKVTAEVDAAFTETPLPPADVHMALAEPRGFPLPDAKAALAHDPLHPVALWSRDRRDRPALARALRASVSAHARDWRAWFLLGQALDEEREGKEREAAFRRAAELNPASAYALNELAWVIVQDGRAAEALPLARRAVELAPSSPFVLDTLAAVAAGVGACPEALALQRRAVDLAREPYEAELRERIFVLEAQCREASRAGEASW